MNRGEVLKCICEIEKGESLEKVAEKRGLSLKMLKAHLLYEGGDKGTQIIIEREIIPKLPVSIEKIEQMLVGGKSIGDIAKTIGMSEDKLIDLILKYKSFSGKKIGKKSSPIDNLKSKEVIEDYRNGDTYVEIAKKYSIPYYLVRKILLEYIEENGDEIVSENRANRKNRKNSSKKCNDILKIPSLEEIEQYLRKKPYSYDELRIIFQKIGYTLPEASYNMVKDRLEAEKGEER